MNRKQLFPAICVLLSTVLLTAGCKKMVHENIQAASNSSVAIISYNDVFEQVIAAVDSSLDQKVRSSWFLSGTVCATVTLAPLGPEFPKTLTIDYGTKCTTVEQKTASGRIVASFSGNLRDQGTVIDVQFEGFSTGQYGLTGKDSIINMGADVDGNLVFKEAIRSAVITWGGQQIRWKARLDRTWKEGADTDFLSHGAAGLTDDVFHLTGTASGNDSNTHPFTLKTSTPLVLQTGCSYIKEGTLVISPANFNDGRVDYGNGNCDKQATLEVEGEVFNFTM